MKQLTYKRDWLAAERRAMFMAQGILHAWYKTSKGETVLVIRRVK